MNPGLFLKTPIYISSENMVVPINSINQHSIYILFTNICEIFTTIFQTFAFIMNNALIALNENLTFTEKILLALILYNFISQSLTEIENINREIKIREKFKSIEIQINNLKKFDTICESWQEVFGEELKHFDKKLNINFVRVDQDIDYYAGKIDKLSKKIKK